MITDNNYEDEHLLLDNQTGICIIENYLSSFIRNN